jgi:large subunit ribosomal protein L19
MIHSPLVTKIQVVKRSKVRRNYLSYMRERTGKSARLSAVNFDQDKVNYVPEPEVKEEPKAETSQETESQEKTEDKPEAEKADKQPEEKVQKPSERKTEEADTEASKKEAAEDKK